METTKFTASESFGEKVYCGVMTEIWGISSRT